MADLLDLCRILDRLLTSLPHFAFLVTDNRFRILYLNTLAARLFDCEIGQCLKPGAASEAQAFLYRALVQQCTDETKQPVLFATLGESVQPLPVTLTTLHDYDGEPIGYGVVATDAAICQAPQKAVFLENVIESLSDPLIVADSDGKIVLLNDAARRLVDALDDKAAAVAMGSPVERLPGNHATAWSHMETVLQHGGAVCITHELGEGPDRQVYDFTFSPLRNEHGHIEGVIKTARDITQRRVVEARLGEQEERVQQLINYDELTNLPSRSLFTDRLHSAIQRARKRRRQVAVLCLDLDNFKKINDSLGHDIGDQVLRQVARRLLASVNIGDTVARLSGDDFFIVLESPRDIEQVRVIVENMLSVLGHKMAVEDYEFYITASLGVSLFPADGEQAPELMRCADAAMHKVKKRGGDDFQFFTAEMDGRALENLALEIELRRALEREEFTVYYQPQIDLETNALVGVEALLRWKHPQRGMVSPAVFIPIAEETGLINEIGAWVMAQACCQNKQWQHEGYEPICMAVNISPRQFRRVDLVAQVAEVLHASGLAAHYLELEITEGIIMDDVESAIETMQQLKTMGVKLSIDDFGTGYSSLSYLRKFTISKLKIDRSFVDVIVEEASAAQIARSIVNLANNLELNVIAEGVETVKQLECLRAMGCCEGQGYLFGRPMTAEQVTGLLKRSTVQHRQADVLTLV